MAVATAAPPAPPVERRPSLLRRVLGDHPTAWVYVAPAVVVVLGLSLVPMAWSLLLSFQSSDLITPGHWVGTRNYSRLGQDPHFRAAIWHTILYTLLFVPLCVAGGLSLALMLDRRIRFIGVYRTLVFVPFVVSAAAQGVLFSFMLDPQFGIANAVLDAAGLPRQQFLQDPGQALYVLVAIGLWSGVGFCVVVYLAALQDIPRDLVEAARIDGAKRWGVLWNVVLPHLKPVTVFLVVWQAIQALQLFDLVFVTTKGGPLDATTTVVFFVWQQAFLFFKAGMGAAAAYILGFGLLVLGIAQVLVRRARERAA
jgi:multiple sugar transport system permease protein